MRRQNLLAIPLLAKGNDMFIHHDHKCVFVHITKTAGISITSVFFPPGKRPKPPHHEAPKQLIKEHPELWNNYFSFAFVRNPWDRLISAFFYRRRVAYKDTQDNKPISPIEQVILEYDGDFETFIINVDKILLSRALHFRPQLSWILGDDKKPFGIDFIGRFENLQEDFNYVCEQIKMPSTELPKLWTSEHKYYIEHYNNITKDIIAHIYKEDIEYFNYKFE